MLDHKYRVRVNREPLLSGDRAQKRSRTWLRYGLIGAGVVAVILIILVIIGSRRGTQQPEPAPTVQTSFTLSVERGTVEVQAPGESDFVAAEDGMTLPEGATVRTEEEALASMELSTGSVVRLNGASRADIEHAQGDGLTLTLVGGEAWVSLVDAAAAPVTVTTPEVRLEVHASAANIAHGRDTSTVTGVEDEVEVIAHELAEGSQQDRGRITLSADDLVAVSAKDIPQTEDDFDVNEVDEKFTDSFWYRWNRELDAQFAATVRGEEDGEGPSLSITSPKEGASLDAERVEVTGVTEISAMVTVNDEDAKNDLGKFSSTVDLNEGKNEIEVIATDATGNRTTKTITVTRAEAKPGAVSLSGSSTEPGKVTLTWGKSSDKDFAKYVIKRDEEQVGSLTEATDTSFTDTGLDDGATYTYKVCVVDTDDLETCSSETKVTVKTAPNTPPTVTISTPVSGSTVQGGTAVAFVAAGTDPEGAELTYTWDFGDGISTTGLSTTHTYAVVSAPATYTITVTVRDQSGATAQATTTLNVTP